MKFAGIAVSAATLTMLMIACADARPVAAVRETNLRKEPRADSDVLVLVPKGTKVEIGQCTKGWCKASWNGQDGYIIMQNLALGGPPRPPHSAMAVEDGPDGADYPPGPPPPAYYPYGPYYYPYGPYYYGRGYYGYGYGWGRRYWW